MLELRNSVKRRVVTEESEPAAPASSSKREVLSSNVGGSKPRK